MKPALSQYVTRGTMGALALAALFGLGSPGSASANSTANTTILNVAKVEYQDASHNNTWYANASTSVIVNLVRTPLNFSGPPSSGGGQPALTCQSGGSFASGSTISALYALTATANGSDTYGLSMGAPVGTNVSNITVDYYNVDYAGTVGAANPASLPNWGSAIPVGVKTGANDTLLFPGGSLAGFALNDIVIVDHGGATGKRAYLVKGFFAGTAPSHANNGGGPYTGLGAGGTEGLTAEQQGWLQLGAFATVNTTWNGTAISFGGNAADPDFTLTPVATGTTVSEMKLIRVDAKASSSSTTADGTVSWTLTTTDGLGASSQAQNCPTTGVWTHSQLSITKQVAKAGSGSYANTVPGGVVTGDILEYKLTIVDSGGTASRVKVVDAVPSYTTLVAGGAYGTYGAAAATNIFAKADVNGGTAVNLTMQSSDTEDNTVASGNTSATAITAGTGMTFYVGAGNTNAQGGDVDNTHTYHIYYQVKVD